MTRYYHRLASGEATHRLSGRRSVDAVTVEVNKYESSVLSAHVAIRRLSRCRCGALYRCPVARFHVGRLQHRNNGSKIRYTNSSGFANQSHFCFHFKRIVGATPRQFQIRKKLSKPARSLKTPVNTPIIIPEQHEGKSRSAA
jgi:hypothetical protein